MKTKILSIVLLLSLLLTFVACKQKDPQNEADTTTEALTTEEPTRVLLSENGNTPYSVVSGKYIATDSLNLLFSFIFSIRSASGAQFGRSGDDVYEGVDYSGKCEIIFGGANRDECREVYDSIGFDGYAVKCVGNKIVIAGYTYDTLKLAADTFLSECIKAEDNGSGINLYYVKDVVYKGTQGLFFTEENPLSKYKIVYNAATSVFASKLAMALEERMGITMSFCKDTDEPSEFEIILGDTARAESDYAELRSDYNYVIKAVGKKLAIRSYSDWSSDDLVYVIMNTFMYSSPTLNFPQNVDVNETKYSGTDRAVLTEGADIRVMSFNILADDFHTDKNLTPRVPGVIGCLRYYKPDVVGFQEISMEWYRILCYELAGEYEFLNTDVIGGHNNNYTGLAYRKETVRHIEDEVLNYRVPGNSRIRLLNTGVFEDKESGKEFIVTSTHLQVGGDKEPHRISEAEEHLARVEKLLWMYQCPVISTGDYNSQEKSAPYNVMIRNDVLKDCRYAALSHGRLGATHHSMGAYPKIDGGAIDYVFCAGDITPLYYSVLTDEILIKTSDHTPIICDFKFS